MISLSHLRPCAMRLSSMPLPDMDLNFLEGAFSSPLTYARASLASEIDAAGLVAISPHNLCVNSEQFSVSWLRENISAFGAGSIADTLIAPDGARTADLIDDGAASGRHIIYQLRAIPMGGNYVASIYVKDLGRRYAQLCINSIGYGAGGFIFVDLQTGVLTQTKAFSSAAPVISSSIENAGDGWFRISLCFRIPGGVTSVFFVVATSDRPNDATGTLLHWSPSYIGSGRKLGVWGAQLEFVAQDTRVRSYVRSNAAPAYQARFDHDPANGAPRGLLIEEGRSNLLLGSQAPALQTISVSAQPYCLSFYGSGSINLSGAASGIIAGAGAYPARRMFTFIPAAGSLTLSISGDVSFAQCEAGAFATSWIPTLGAASSRAADDLQLRSDAFADWLNPSAGAFFVEASRLGSQSRGDVFHVRNLSNAALCDVNVFGAAGGAFGVSMRTAIGILSANSQGAFGSAAPARAAFAYGAGEGAVSINGASAVAGSGVLDLSQANAMTIGSNVGPTRHFLNGHIRRIRYYRSRLSNAVLQKMSA